MLPLARFLAGVIAWSAPAEVGQRLGAAADANVLTLEAAMLGLLALRPSFASAIAVTCFDARRDAVLKEANAIGTAASRGRLLPAPYDGESLRLFRDTVQIRLDVIDGATPPEMEVCHPRSNAIQERLRQELKCVAAKANAMVPTGLYA